MDLNLSHRRRSREKLHIKCDNKLTSDSGQVDPRFGFWNPVQSENSNPNVGFSDKKAKIQKRQLFANREQKQNGKSGFEVKLTLDQSGVERFGPGDSTFLNT